MSIEPSRIARTAARPTGQALTTAEASLRWTAATGTSSTDAKTISWGTPNGSDIYMAAYSASGTCYYLKSVAGAVTYTSASGSTNCNAHYAFNTATGYASAWTS